MKQKEEVLRLALESRTILEAYAFTVLKDWDLAADAVQEATVQVGLNLGKYEDFSDKKLLNWLKVMTRNKSVDILRKRKRAVYSDNLTPLLDDYFDDHLAEVVSPLSQKRQQHLKKCLKKIDPEKRRIMLGFYRDGQNTEDLGKQYKKTANSIRVIIHRCRDALRRCINIGVLSENE